MSKTGILRTWKVLPHGPLTEVEPGLLTVVGQVRMPFMDFPRRMTVVGLDGNRTAIFSPVALGEADMARIETLGSPAFLIVPSIHHRRDIGVWKARYPDAQVVAPAGARAAVEEVVGVDTTLPSLDDPAVEFVAVPGTQEREAALIVRRADVSVIVSDIIGNMPRGSGFAGWLARLMGYAGDEPQIPMFARRKLIADKEVFKTWLSGCAALPGLKRVVVAHGAIIDAQPAQTLRKLSADL